MSITGINIEWQGRIDEAEGVMVLNGIPIELDNFEQYLHIEHVLHLAYTRGVVLNARAAMEEMLRDYWKLKEMV